LVAVNTYVVVAAGVSASEPVDATVPIPGVIETDVASATVQCSVEAAPDVTVLGDA